MTDTPIRSGPQVNINFKKDLDQKFSRTAVLSDGNVIVVWLDLLPDLNSHALKARILSPSGSAVSPEFIVGASTASAKFYPDVAALAGGGFVINWTEEGTTLGQSVDDTIRGQLYNNDGSANGGEFLIDPGTNGRQTFSSVAALTGGGFVVTWNDRRGSNDPNEWDVLGQLFDRNGASVGSRFRVNDTVAGMQTDSDITVLPTGTFVVAWMDSNKNSGDISVRQFRADGTALGSETIANTTTAGNQSRPQITGLANGGYVVTWQSGNVRGQVFSSAGQKVGSEFQIPSAGAGSTNESSVTGLTDGSFIVVWSDTQSPQIHVRGQRFSANGATIGSAFTIDTLAATSGGIAQSPSVVATAGGNFFVTWSNRATGSSLPNGFEILGQSFSTGTGDTTAPLLVTRTPLDNAICVARNTEIVLQFNEAVKAGSGAIILTNLTTGGGRTISVTPDPDAPISGDTVAVSGNTMTITLGTPLSANNDIQVTFGSGVITDQAGNPFAGLSAGDLNFRTKADTFQAAVDAGFSDNQPFSTNNHLGSDLNLPGDADRGKPAYAIGGGTVLPPSTSADWGNNVILEHTLDTPIVINGKTFSKIYSLYGHLSTTKASTGNDVCAGDVVGTIGSTGRSDGAHLHLQIMTDASLQQGYAQGTETLMSGRHLYRTGPATNYNYYIDPTWFISQYNAGSTVFDVAAATASFSPYAYAAMNPDLYAAFSGDISALTQHYISNGQNEGRTTSGFDPNAYAANNPDLFAAFGTDAPALTAHYISHGQNEGRTTTGFDPYAYAANNTDLLAAFGTDIRGLVQHYITYGSQEGRTTSGFDPYAYAANNPDLLAAFGTNADALTRHYASNGRSEGRTTYGFDPYAYAAVNPDLFAAFGTNIGGLVQHYVATGRNEGRDTGFGRPASVASPVLGSA